MQLLFRSFAVKSHIGTLVLQQLLKLAYPFLILAISLVQCITFIVVIVRPRHEQLLVDLVEVFEFEILETFDGLRLFIDLF